MKTILNIQAYQKKYGKYRFLVFCPLLIIVCLLPSGCKKMISVPPPATSINAGNIFAADNTAIAAVNAIYFDSNISDFFVNGALLADEVRLIDAGNFSYTFFYQNALTRNFGFLPWELAYRKLFFVNAAIEGISSSETLTPAVRQQLLGEAKFMRAYFYFYLVNLFGDVPLALGTDPQVNRLLPRTPVSDIYAQVITDLKDAQRLLSKNYLGGNLNTTTTERVRPTFWAATALLARVYLYHKDYRDAITQADEVINNVNFSLSPLNTAFLKNSTETIFAFQTANETSLSNTREAELFLLTPAGIGAGTSFFYLSEYVYDAFEAGDDRKAQWTSTLTFGGQTYPYATKYKSGVPQTAIDEYEIVLRLGEQYLIRAEARARLAAPDLVGAIADLNTLRTRARAVATVAIPNPLPDLPAGLTQAQVLVAVEHERQTELFTEWGHRWFDLIRSPGFNDSSKTRADEVMPAVAVTKGGTWAPFKKLLPIPQSEFNADPNLGSQNPGY
ncbi:SusD family protein [Mucilaginibacter pineti]|uniref:SusD family protein n=1 Tax=Mucilaginibacter pineti TaxID=1391627 RepID=A0A1G7IGZ9_9SPHI|nr:RagB/SusD family nutrient uptake outer membrane protein [Mucilaginibacter pineti]SDF12011.1 SusD family protein [Mucilaginibacter pineti]